MCEMPPRCHLCAPRRGIAVAIAALLAPALSLAGGGASTGGATEITQLANHAELAASVAKEAEMVEQNVQAQITRLQNLVQVPSGMIDRTFSPYGSQLASYQSLFSAVSQLRFAAESTSSLFGRSMSEMGATGMTPSQWLTAYSSLAATRGGLYRQQLDSDMSNLDNLAARAQNLQEIQSQIPNVTGNVQGLQMLNQQSNVLAGEMVDLHALVARQVAQQMQDRAAQSDVQANAARLAAARAASAKAINDQEKQMIQGAPDLNLLDDQQ
ncbi:conjugal transfer protein TrbJ [Trinickia symbiotica]|uniref:conjugal transfer protein TrbJ n=1 Tax=Trinickia symbiotica TaxID=863227 RepID=UPI001F437B19|nr:conjugal transfer protein TrbJ [Trinickia symbiotica]